MNYNLVLFILIILETKFSLFFNTNAMKTY